MSGSVNAKRVGSMNAEDDGTVIGYMCYIDWECELGAAMGGNKIYPSVDDLKRNHECWESCGIVEVRVAFSKVIAENRMLDEELSPWLSSSPA